MAAIGLEGSILKQEDLHLKTNRQSDMESYVGEGHLVASTRGVVSVIENKNSSKFQDKVANQEIFIENSICRKGEKTDDAIGEASIMSTSANLNTVSGDENLLLYSTTAGTLAGIANPTGSHASNGTTIEPIGRIDEDAVARRMEANGARAACQLDKIKEDADLGYKSKSVQNEENKSVPNGIATNKSILGSGRSKDIIDHTEADSKAGKDAATNVEFKSEHVTGQTSKYKEKEWKNVFQVLSTFYDNAKTFFCRQSYERHLSRMSKSGMGAWRAGNVPSDVILHNLVHVRT